MANYFTSLLVFFLCVKLSLFLLSTASTAVEETEVPTVSTKNVTAHYCPFPCTVGNATTCYPIPCPPPPCVDPARYKPTDCCVFCPHGANCRGPHGSLIPWNHWKIIDGKNCTCKYMAGDAICV